MQQKCLHHSAFSSRILRMGLVFSAWISLCQPSLLTIRKSMALLMYVMCVTPCTIAARDPSAQLHCRSLL